MIMDHVFRDVVDIGPGVTVRRYHLTAGTGEQGAREPVDLGAVVVEVVLPGHRCPVGDEDPGERVSYRGPPGAADVQRAGRIGGDVLQVEPLPGEGIVTPVVRTRFDDDLGQLA